MYPANRPTAGRDTAYATVAPDRLRQEPAPGGAASANLSVPEMPAVPPPATTSTDRWTAIVDEHRPVVRVMLAFLAAAFVVDLLLSDVGIFSFALYSRAFASILWVCLVTLWVGYLVAGMWRAPRGEPLFVWLLRDLRYEVLTRERIAGFLIVVVYMRVLGTVFINLKAAIPQWAPFAWDATFMRFDRMLHGGQHPWQWFQPLASPPVTTAINVCYNLWAFVLAGFFFWQGWLAYSARRRQFFVTFGLCWIVIGLVAASLFSSAGPCYYARVTGNSNDPYASLMQYLHEAQAASPVWALQIQQQLWDYYERQAHAAGDGRATADRIAQSSDASVVKGISAMPSMHVSMCVLMALTGWHRRRWLGIGLGVFAAVIQLGSFHLGWHYAIDGYASAVMTVAIWWGVGRSLGIAPTRGAARTAGGASPAAAARPTESIS